MDDHVVYVDNLNSFFHRSSEQHLQNDGHVVYVDDIANFNTETCTSSATIHFSYDQTGKCDEVVETENSTCIEEPSRYSPCQLDTSQTTSGGPEQLHVRYTKRRAKAVNREDIRKMLMQPCGCQLDCFKAIKEDDVLRCREHYMSKTKDEKITFLGEVFMVTDFTKDGIKSPQHTIIIGQHSAESGGIAVCQKAWYQAYGISRTSYFRHLKEYRERGYTPETSSQTVHWDSPAVMIAKAWLDEYIKKNGDKMPDRAITNLPSSVSVSAMFKEYEASINSPISRASFYRLWVADYAETVKIPPINRFAKCDTCETLKETLRTGIKGEARTEVEEQRKAHLEIQSSERTKYYKHIKKAMDNPDKYLSIILDGMDQGKTSLPHFCKVTKSDAGVWRLKTRISGAIVHGRKTFVYIDPEKYQQDPNLTINLLLKIFHELAKDAPSLPEVLYLQMDNCFRENKNRFVLGFCHNLIARNIFRKIKMSFLMKGHTHEDVDQFFSRVSVKLAKSDTLTISDLSNVIRNVNTGNQVTVETLDQMLDIKNWMGPHLTDIHGHTTPHVFRFKKNSEGAVAMTYKDWSTSEAWKELVLEEDVTFFKQMPQGKPKVLEPKSLDESEKTKLAQTSEKLYESGRFTKLQKEEWDRDIQTLTATSQQEEVPFLLDGIAPYYSQDNHRPLSEDTEHKMEVLRQARKRDNPDAMVYLGPRKRAKPTEILCGNFICFGFANRKPKIGIIQDKKGKVQVLQGTLSGQWVKTTRVLTVDKKDKYPIKVMFTKSNRLTERTKKEMQEYLVHAQ